MNIKIVRQILIVMLGLVCCAFGRDWPQWRGPFLNGSTDEKNLPNHWSSTENICWISDLPGSGAATPIVCKGKVFVTAEGKKSKELIALCISADDGKELWRRIVGSGNRKWPRGHHQNMAGCSAATDGERVYFLFGNGHLKGMDYEGNVLWSRNLEKEYGNLALLHGFCSSLLLKNDKLYIAVLRQKKSYRPPESVEPLDSFVLALDAKSGKQIWKQQRETDAISFSLEAYSTPIFLEAQSRQEIVVLGGDYFTGHDPENGTEFWRLGYRTEKGTKASKVASPVTAEGLIFATGDMKGQKFIAIQSGGSGRLSLEKDVTWKFEGPSSSCCTPAYYQGRLYMLADIRNSKELICFEAKTGKQIWKGDLGGKGPWRASPVVGDGKVYCINEAGEVVVLAAGQDQFKILSRIQLEDGPALASMAIAQERLFIRTANKLFCVGQ